MAHGVGTVGLLPVVLGVVVVFCSGLLLMGCRPAAPQAPADMTPPRTTAIPAGGIWRAWPTEIRLVVDEAATIFYAWDGTTAQRYAAPIRVPASQAGHLTLTFWAQDAARNREPPRRDAEWLGLGTAPRPRGRDARGRTTDANHGPGPATWGKPALVTGERRCRGRGRDLATVARAGDRGDHPYLARWRGVW